ncbi:MAG: aminoacyl-tRNA hydrolase [Chloroflexota bacterium]|nr:aminoacyl-tRNA hydrolase [Chloroflexota bacterium]
MKLLIGLGNPGSQYAQTRHNVGFRVVDMLATRHGWKWSEQRGRAILASGTIGAEKVVLAKPLTFMNLSGEAVGELLRWYKVSPEEIVVIYDEMDLPLGIVRLRPQGSAGGHNGIENIIRHLHTNEFPRVRVGIGRPTHKSMDTVRYVLGIPAGDERILLAASEERAVEAVELLLAEGIGTAMNTINIDPEAQRKAEEKRQRQRERQEQALARRQERGEQAQHYRITIGMNARMFPNNWRPLRNEIAFAHAQSLQYIQFRAPESGLTAEQLGDPLETVAGQLSSAHMKAVMEIVIRLNAAGRTSSGTTLIDVLQANLPAITTLSCIHAHFHVVPIEAMDEEARRNLEELLIPQFRQGLAIAATHRFLFGFEHNEPGTDLFATPERCATLLEAVPGLGFVWDLNHATLEQLPAYLALASRMTMLHIADTPLPEVNYHLPLGQGAIDFTLYCQALMEGGFHGPAILEIGGLLKSGGFGRDTDAALIDSAKRLREAINDAYGALKKLRATPEAHTGDAPHRASLS